MPLQVILKKIEDASVSESEEILALATEQGRKIKEEAEGQAEAKKREILEAAAADADRMGALAKTRGGALRRQMVLGEKQSAIDSVFEEAQTALATMPSSEYSQIVAKSVARCAAGTETLVLGQEDKEKLGQGFGALVNRALADAGKPGEVKIEYAQSSLGGGYILRSGGVSQNVTFPSLMRVLRDDLEIEVAEKIFGLRS